MDAACSLHYTLLHALLLLAYQEVPTLAANSTVSGNTTEGKFYSERDLVRYLLDDYDVRARPVLDSTHSVNLSLGLVLIQIADVDEVNQIFAANIWVRHIWHDDYLKWNPEKFNGLTKFRFPSENVWLPDIVLYNSTDSSNVLFPKQAEVTFEGQVFWVPHGIYRVPCKIDVTYFPYDVQSCSMKFGSWMYDNFQLDLQLMKPNDINTANYMPSEEWDLLSITSEISVVGYQREAQYSHITYTFSLKRRVLYHMINIVFPCLWLSVLSIMTFWLPPDSGEKITLGITVLLAFSVFMLLVAESMPKTSESVPLIGIYLCVTMSLTSMTIIQTIIVKKLCYVGPQAQRMSPWLRNFTFNYLARFLCIGKFGSNKVGSLNNTEDRSDEVQAWTHYGRSVSMQQSDLLTELSKDGKGTSPAKNTDEDPSGDKFKLLVRKLMNQNESKCLMNPELLTIEEEWEMFGLMLDKMSFIIYSAVTITVTLCILAYTPATSDQVHQHNH